MRPSPTVVACKYRAVRKTFGHSFGISIVSTRPSGNATHPYAFFGSPRVRPAVKARYLQTPLPEQDVLPLRMAEKDITLAHVLSLCTPPSDYPSRDRILTSVQYIVSRMAEPFSIQGTELGSCLACPTMQTPDLFLKNSTNW